MMRMESRQTTVSALPVSEVDLPDRLRQAIRPYLPERPPSLAKMAETWGVSPRTLQRRLGRTGKSYRELVQETRLDLARDLLRNSDSRLVDVALAAGYSDQAHFNRAFRRWTGVPPGEYRVALRSHSTREH